MTELGSASPVEQRVLTALYTGAACAFMIVLVWQQLDPDGGPADAFARARARLSEWRRAGREYARTYTEIVELPETEDRDE